MLTLVDAKDTLDQNLLKTLFLQKLPTTVQTVLALAVDDLTLETLALQADKIVEINSRTETVATVREPAAPTVNAYHHPPRATQVPPPVPLTDLTPLLEALKDIKSSLQSLAARNDRSEQMQRDRERREKSKSPQRSQSKARDTSKYDTCWYHFKFGANASRCDKPCAFKQGNANPES
jgi:hypothetical protein